MIDSVTHEWEGPGGCQEIAAATKFPDWKRAKAEHKRFITHMLQSQAHIIACTRAREKTDFTDTKNPVKLGIQPIQESNFSYEATVSLMMHDQGRRQDVLKCPAELQDIMGRGQGYVGANDGGATNFTGLPAALPTATSGARSLPPWPPPAPPPCSCTRPKLPTATWAWSPRRMPSLPFPTPAKRPN